MIKPSDITLLYELVDKTMSEMRSLNSDFYGAEIRHTLRAVSTETRTELANGTWLNPMLDSASTLVRCLTHPAFELR